MQFFNPEALLFLWSIPALIGIFFLSRRIWKQRIHKFGYYKTIETKLMPTYRTNEHRVQLFYLIIVLTLCSLALARPQWGEEKRKIERKGVDIIFMLDTSLSMMAEDAKPNRLEKSKRQIKNFVKQLDGDRVGMVAFAGSGFLQSPLTLDYSAFFLFLDAIKIGYIPDPGTSIDRAVRMATTSFPENNLKHKAMVLFSDGEDHQGGLESAIKAAQDRNVRIYTLGVASEQGEPIPLKDAQGKRTGFKKDRSGEIVITKLNQPLLEKLAAETGGLYLPSTPAELETDLILRHMETLDKQQYKERLVTEKEDHYQVFLLFAFIFLVIEMLVRRTRKVPTNFIPIIACFFLFSGFIETPRSLNEEANQLFEEKKYQSAAELYQKAKTKNPDDPVIRYNLASTLYQMQEHREAASELEKALEKLGDEDPMKAKALYNYGNTQYRLGNFEKAIKSYENALELNPEDTDAKYNLEFLQKQKSMFDDKNQEKSDPDKQEEDSDQPNDQQQDQQDQQSQGSDQNQEQDQQNQQNQQNQDQENQQNQQNQQDQQQDQKDQQSQQDQQNQNQSENNQEQQDQDQQDQQQQGGQGEQEKDQEQKEQGQGEQENEQEKEQGQGQEQNEQEQEKEDQDQQSESGKDEEDPESQNEQQSSPEQDQQGEAEENQQEQQKEEEPDPQGNQERDQPQPQDIQPRMGGGRGNKPLQGQMSKDNALRILDALKGSEKELQDLRQPRPPRNPPSVEKDW